MILFLVMILSIPTSTAPDVLVQWQPKLTTVIALWALPMMPKLEVSGSWMDPFWTFWKPEPSPTTETTLISTRPLGDPMMMGKPLMVQVLWPNWPWLKESRRVAMAREIFLFGLQAMVANILTTATVMAMPLPFIP